MSLALLGAVLLAAAPVAPEGGHEGTAAATSVAALEQGLLAKAEAALSRGDPASLDEAARAFEMVATTSADPGPAWVKAARVRRGLAEAASMRAAAQRGGAAGPQLELAAREAQICSDDARRAWRLAAPEAAASQSTKAPVEVAALVAAPGAEALYLDAVCAGLWARAQGVTPLLDRVAELRAFFSRAAALVPGLDDAGPDRELGRLLAAIPAYAGGDVDLAKRHFEAALKASPSARTRLAYAESVAVKLQDRKLFETLLAEVVAATDDKTPLADKARALLQRTDDLFGKAQ